jgi:hypothetical protein
MISLNYLSYAFTLHEAIFCHQITHVLGALCILVMPNLPFDKIYGLIHGSINVISHY